MLNIKKIFKVKIPTSNTGKFFLFFVGEIVSSILITCDYRAIALVRYMWTCIINFLFFVMNWWFLNAIKKAEEGDDSFWIGFGYVTGGILGALIGLWITVHLYGR